MFRKSVALSVMSLMMIFGLASATLQAGTSATPATAAPSTATSAVKAAPATAAELKGRLLELASRGQLTDGVITLFKQYAEAHAHEKFAQEVPAKFWTWLDTDKASRDALLVALHPYYDIGVVRKLMALQEKFPDQINDYRSLALAFAVVYGRLGDQPLTRNYLTRSRPKTALPAPSMEESFEYYVKNERAMYFPMKRTPWPLLAFVADNDLPLADRQWALNRCGKLDYAKFDKVYYEPPYDGTAISDRVGKLAGQDYTLENIRNDGGICGDRAYYASRIFKSLGVPSLFEIGKGDRGGHAWVSWMNPKGGEVDLAFSGRFDFDKYYTGIVWDPTIRQPCLDRDVQLMLIAVQQSYNGYQEALIGSYVYRLCAGAARKPAVGLLKDAVRNHNAYCAEPWRDLAAATAEQLMPRAEGEQMFDDMFGKLAKYPDLTFEALSDVLKPRLEGSADTDPETISKNLHLLDAAFGLYEKAKRPDLATVLRVMQGQYLEKVGRGEDALKLYVTNSEKYADQHYGVVELFDSAMKLLAVPAKDELRMKYLDLMAHKVPQYTSDFNRKYNLPNSIYTHVVEAYVAALKTAGKTAEAEQWAGKLDVKSKN